MSAGLGYEEAGVEIGAGGFVVTDESCRTTLDGVFAAGDVAGPPLLAHWAYHQGAIAAENAVTGADLHCDRTLVPSCTFSSPEVASCGITEDRAKAEGIAHEVAHVRFNGNSKAVCDGDAEGFVRIVCEPGGGRVLGASLIGPHVTELVHELALAAHSGLTLADVAATIHAHPTLSEAVGEAALGGARARRAQHLSAVAAPEDKQPATRRPRPTRSPAASRRGSSTRRRRRRSTAPPAPCSTSWSCTRSAARRAVPTRGSATPPAPRRS